MALNPSFNVVKTETLVANPNLIFTVILFLVVVALIYITVKKVKNSKKPKKIAYVEGQVLQLTKTEHGQFFAHPLDTSEKDVVTKLVDGMLVYLLVPHHFQTKYKTKDVVKARYINPKKSKAPNGEKLIDSWGFVFPDYYQIGALTFAQIVNEPQFSLIDYIEKQVQAVDEEIYRPEPERKFLTTT